MIYILIVMFIAILWMGYHIAYCHSEIEYSKGMWDFYHIMYTHANDSHMDSLDKIIELEKELYDLKVLHDSEECEITLPPPEMLLNGVPTLAKDIPADAELICKPRHSYGICSPIAIMENEEKSLCDDEHAPKHGFGEAELRAMDEYIMRDTNVINPWLVGYWPCDGSGLKSLDRDFEYKGYRVKIYNDKCLTSMPPIPMYTAKAIDDSFDNPIIRGENTNIEELERDIKAEIDKLKGD